MLDREKLKEELTAAGNKFDGHVTAGSLNAQLVILEHYLLEITKDGYPIDVWGNCAECGGGPEGSILHERTCKHWVRP